MNFGFLKFGSLLLLGAPAPGRPHMSFHVSPCYKKEISVQKFSLHPKIINCTYVTITNMTKERILIGALNHCFFLDFYEHIQQTNPNENVW